MARVALVACVLGALLASVSARKHKLKFKRDNRRVAFIEEFGFAAGGTFDIDVSDLHVYVAESEEDVKLGFVLRKSKSESSFLAIVEDLEEKRGCLLDAGGGLAEPDDVVLDLTSTSRSSSVQVPEAGLYGLIFQRCRPQSNAHVTLTANIVFRNPNGSYLSVGEQPLVTLYFLFALAFLGVGVAWVRFLRQHNSAMVHLHHMITALFGAKFLSLLFEALMFLGISHVGHPTGWAGLFYVFVVVKTLLFFTVLLLLGTGWTLLKPFLSDRERKVLFVVLTLQVLANIALIVTDEIAPGSRAFSNWTIVLHVADLACCGAVVFPILWSMRHLQSAAAADGKARTTLQRLAQFRRLYIATVIFLYVTRICVLVIESGSGYRGLWVGPTFDELASLTFFCFLAYTFRPGGDNPYVRVREEDEEDEEFGLEDGDEIDTAGGDVERGQRVAVEVAVQVSNKPAQAPAAAAAVPSPAAATSGALNGAVVVTAAGGGGGSSSSGEAASAALVAPEVEGVGLSDEEAARQPARPAGKAD